MPKPLVENRTRLDLDIEPIYGDQRDAPESSLDRRTCGTAARPERENCAPRPSSVLGRPGLRSPAGEREEAKAKQKCSRWLWNRSEVDGQ